jgi:integrase
MEPTTPLVDYLNSFSPASRRQRRTLLAEVMKRLDLASDFTDWETLSVDRVRQLRDGMAVSFSPATVNNALSALRGVLKAAGRAGVLSVGKYLELTSFPGVSVRQPNKSTPDPNVQRMVEACWTMNTPVGYRDAFVCAAYFGDRLSAAEILNLRDGDIDTGTGELRGLRRILYLGDFTKKALMHWNRTRNDRTGPIVKPLRGSGKSKSVPEQLVYDILRRCVARVGAAENYGRRPL